MGVVHLRLSQKLALLLNVYAILSIEIDLVNRSFFSLRTPCLYQSLAYTTTGTGLTMLQEHIACADCLEVDCLIADFALSIAEVFHECFLTLLLPSGKSCIQPGKAALTREQP